MQLGNNPFLYEIDFAFEEDVWYHIGIAQVKQIWATTFKVYINGALIQTIQVSNPPPIHGNISLTFGTPVLIFTN